MCFVKAAAEGSTASSGPAIGDIITFGRYEQDNDLSNGAEAIEWIVLAREGDTALLLSKYGLDVKPYNEEHLDITWEDCTLRTWLNSDFLNAAFNADEQAQILLTDVDNSQSQCYSKWSTKGGNDTQDMVFLLSYAEANKYLGVTYDNSSNTKSQVTPTAYAKANGAYTNIDYKTEEGTAAGWWWFRSPGRNQGNAASVSSDGSLYDHGVYYVNVVVRPAVVLRLSD